MDQRERDCDGARLRRSHRLPSVVLRLPLPGRFNVVVAIESLIDSPDPAHTVANLAAAIDPGGRMIIVDDMPVDDVADSDMEFLAEFKRCWRCPVAPGAAGWIAAAGAAGLRLVGRNDLSGLMKPRAEGDLDAAFADLSSRFGEKASAGFARLSDAEIGGLHLERLHRRGTIRYTMLGVREDVKVGRSPGYRLRRGGLRGLRTSRPAITAFTMEMFQLPSLKSPSASKNSSTNSGRTSSRQSLSGSPRPASVRASSSRARGCRRGSTHDGRRSPGCGPRRRR